MAREEKPKGAAMPALQSAPESLGEVLGEKPAEIPKVEGSVGPINVVALSRGWYKCARKEEGDKFTIDSEKQLGSWMKKI